MIDQLIKIKNTIFGESEFLEIRILIRITVIGTVIGLTIFLMNWPQISRTQENIGILALVIFMVCLFCILRFLPKYHSLYPAFAQIAVLFAQMIISYTWLQSIGSFGGNFFLFFIFVAVHTIFFKKWLLFLNVILTILIVSTLMVYEYRFSSSFTLLENNSPYTVFERYLDVLSVFIASCFLLYLIIQTIKAEHDKLVRHLLQKSHIQAEDLLLARNLQKQVFDYKAEDVSGYDFAVRVMPSLELGGDLFDLSRPTDDRLRIFLADARGHGVNAALCAMLIKSSWRNINQPDQDPGSLLQTLNKNIMGAYSDTMSFTAVVCDIYKNKIIYSSAGHPPQYLIQMDKIIALENSGPPSGMFENTVYTSKQLDISRSARLLLYTDALVEEVDAIDENGKQWLESKLSYPEGSSEDYIKHLIKEFAAKLKQNPESLSLHDDLMIVSIQLGS